MTAAQLQQRLADLAGSAVELTLTDNTASMIHCRLVPDACRLRLHRLFLQADEEVLLALVDFIRGRRRRGATKVLRRFIREREKEISSQPRQHLGARGQHHDLQRLFDRLNQNYFAGNLSGRIGWGRKRSGVRRRIRLGTLCERSGVIRINPILDHPGVPEYVVAGVVFHEMLHLHLGVQERGGRRYRHTSEFRQLAATYRFAEEMQDWLTSNGDFLSGRKPHPRNRARA